MTRAGQKRGSACIRSIRDFNRRMGCGAGPRRSGEVALGPPAPCRDRAKPIEKNRFLSRRGTKREEMFFAAVGGGCLNGGGPPLVEGLGGKKWWGRGKGRSGGRSG